MFSKVLVLVISNFFLCVASSSSLSPSPSISSSLKSPLISSLMKPNLFKRMVEDKEIMTYASLDDANGQEGLKKYSFYAAMLVGASVSQTSQTLTDYRLYAQMIPYVDKAEYSHQNHILQLEGGIWNFRLRSQILFDQVMDRWIHYAIIGGHFSGLTGDIYFEPFGEKGTLVYLRGEQLGTVWPPQFVIERGAEIAFGFTAKRMRSYIESRKKEEKGAKDEQQEREQIPRPRSHL